MEKQFSTSKWKSRLQVSIVIGLSLSLLILQPLQISYAQTELNPEPTEEIELSDPPEEAEQPTENLPQTQTLLLPFEQFIPYVQFLNYQYQGDGTSFITQDIIMEYTPDSNGVFQVAAFTENKAIAYIYQIRADGLYELAFFDHYDVVQDLRYSELALDGNDSLVLSSNLNVGSTFYSGYQNESRRTVVDIIDYYSAGTMSYENVIVIAEDAVTNSDGSYQQYYVAPNYGIVAIERVYPDKSTVKVIELTDTQGFLQ